MELGIIWLGDERFSHLVLVIGHRDLVSWILEFGSLVLVNGHLSIGSLSFVNGHLSVSELINCQTVQWLGLYLGS